MRKEGDIPKFADIFASHALGWTQIRKNETKRPLIVVYAWNAFMNKFYILLIVSFPIVSIMLCTSYVVANKRRDSTGAKIYLKASIEDRLHTCVIPTFNSVVAVPRIPFAAKGDELYCGRKLLNGVPIYFIVDSTNLARSETCERGAAFYSEEHLQRFVQMHYPNVKLKKCPCGCWGKDRSLGIEGN